MLHPHHNAVYILLVLPSALQSLINLLAQLLWHQLSLLATIKDGGEIIS